MFTTSPLDPNLSARSTEKQGTCWQYFGFLNTRDIVNSTVAYMIIEEKGNTSTQTSINSHGRRYNYFHNRSRDYRHSGKCYGNYRLEYLSVFDYVRVFLYILVT